MADFQEKRIDGKNIAIDGDGNKFSVIKAKIFVPLILIILGILVLAVALIWYLPMYRAYTG